MNADTSITQRGAARAAAILVLILVLVTGAGYVYLRAEQRRMLTTAADNAMQKLEQTRAEGETLGRELAEDIGRILSVTLADNVALVENATLDLKLAAIVRGKRVAGIIVLSPDGAVLATTDLRYAGRTLDDPDTIRALNVQEATVVSGPPGQIEVDAPLRSAGEKVGALRVFVDLGTLVR